MSNKIPGAVTSHTIADHEGIVAVEPKVDGEQVEISFDSTQLSELDIRRIALEHIRPTTQGLQRRALQLDGRACEAAALKLQRRIEKVPGIRRATATYIGRVLCLTFDSAIASEASVLKGVRAAGARIRPLVEKSAETHPTIWNRVRAGEHPEEISCLAGLFFLVVAVLIEHRLGKGIPADALYLLAYTFSGQFGVRAAVASLREHTLDVDVLMVLAAFGAAAIGAPFEGALLLFLFSFSNVLQSHALDRTRRAIEGLLTLRPKNALRKKPATTDTEIVLIEDLVPGDIVLVRPGELMPVDGAVIDGSSHVDEASLTGESMPVSKEKGAAVFAGTLNQSGSLEVRVDRKSEDSTLARMVKLVAEAQAEKSAAQRFLEKAEQWYAGGIIAFTILVGLVPWLFWHEPFAAAFYRAMTVLVVASPCALIISTPATTLSAIGGAARRGILIKGGAALQRASRVDIVCIDKTGTLTTGKPGITEILTTAATERMGGELSSEGAALLRICAALEAKSEHPLGVPIVGAAKSAGLEVPDARAFQSIPGKGVEAEIDGLRYIVGSPRSFAEQRAVGMEPFADRVLALQAEGKTCIWLGQRFGDGVRVLGVFALADKLRPEARGFAAEIRRLGIRKVVVLTGDQTAVARRIANEAGIDQVQAELLPADKVQAIRELKREGTVMMIGDGVNDAPALASADLGVAMGAAGSDVAMETADVVLMGDRLENIALLVGTARHAERVLRQNLTFAAGVIVLLVISALGFALPLPFGVIGHEGSTVLVCLNGLRLLVYRAPK